MAARISRGKAVRFELDLQGFFDYDISLRLGLLHRLFPRESFASVSRFHAFLQREKDKRGRFPLKPSLDGSMRGAALSPNPKVFSLKVPGKTSSRAWNLRIQSRIQKAGRASLKDLKSRGGATAWFDADRLLKKDRSLKWKIRAWKPGDRFQPLGMAGTKKLQDFFVDAKVPLEERRRVPILEVGEKIRWVLGYRTDEESKVRPDSKRVIELQVSPL